MEIKNQSGSSLASTKSKVTLFSLYLLVTIVLSTGSPTPNPKMPPMAAKAGGRMKPGFIQPMLELENGIEIPLVPLEELDEDDFDYQEEVSDEKTCDEGTYWHNRGQQCVPERCPYGRDQETGKCRALDNEGYYVGGYGGGSGGRGGGSRSSWLRRAQANRARGFARGRAGGRGGGRGRG